MRLFATAARVVGIGFFWRAARFVDWLRGRATLESHRILRELLEVHGFEVFNCELFNGDPHAGNILLLPDGRLGLIDYGQSRPELLTNTSSSPKMTRRYRENPPDLQTLRTVRSVFGC